MEIVVTIQIHYVLLKSSGKKAALGQTMYFHLDVLLGPEDSSVWNTRRVEDMVRRTRELWRKEKKELKVNWVAQMMENIGAGNLVHHADSC